MKVTLLCGAVITALGVSAQAHAYNCQSLNDWDKNAVYTSGDQVQTQGSAYQAAWWTRGSDPVSNSGQWEVWKNLGVCDGGQPNQAPTLSFASPTFNAEIPAGSVITLLANASDPDGEVVQVEFFAAGQSIATVTTPPFQTDWLAAIGTATLTAIATDDRGATKATEISINVLPQTGETPPSVTLVSPNGADAITAGDVVAIAAQAQDADGTINQVEFFVNNQPLSVDASAPYEYLWVAEAGTYTFKAQATDDSALSTMSEEVTVVVTPAGSGGGEGCADAVPFVAGERYNAGDLVSNFNEKYRCDVGGWCSSNAAWAYEPGKGQYWQDAWTALGACTTPPQITLDAPSDGQVVLAGSNLTLSANASDADGSVTQVEFFVNQTSLGVVTSAPYTLDWNATVVGTNVLKAVATDNDNNTTEAMVNVTVSDKDLVVSLLSPSAGQTVGLGKNLAMKAEATSLTAAVERVDFLVNGAVVASDNTAPYTANWTPSAIGSFTVSAQAVDTSGTSVLSSAAAVKVVEQAEKRHKLIGYWHNFVNGAGCPIRLAEMSEAWDVIDIAFAENDRNSNGTVHFNLYNGDIRSDCPALDPNQFKQDMAALQAKGKKFVLSLGGAEGTITLNTDADEREFVSSLSAIIAEWGFDGLDVDYESGSNLVHGSEIQKRLGRALLEIEQNMGGDMYLTMAPEHPYVQGGMVAYSGIWGAYVPVINDTRSTLDLLHVQLYNNGGLPNPYLGGAAPEGSVDMMVAQSKMLIEGFELADGSFFEPLTDAQVAIGLPSGPRSANSGQAPTQNILDALDCLTKGTRCGTVKPAFNYTNFGGVMTWSINWDQYDGFNFSKPVGDKLTQMNAE